MSAAQTRQKIERMKLMPLALALLSASQAVHKATRPTAQRSIFGNCGQPAGPARNARAPPNTQTRVAIHHAAEGASPPQPAHSAAPQPAASKTPIATAT